MGAASRTSTPPRAMLPPFDPWLSSAVAADVASASHASANALAARRVQRLARLLASAARRSPLYRRLLKGRDLARLRLADLPIMRKADLMGHFDDWVTDPEVRLEALRRFIADRSRIAEPFLGRYVVWESSGSSGDPAIFIQDVSAMAVYDALESLRRPMFRPLQRLLDPLCLGERIVFVGATGGHFASTVSIERLRRLYPSLSRDLHCVSFLQPTRQLVAELQALAPTIIATARRSFCRSRPNAIAVPAGEAGASTLLTNLANHLQPLIRYDLGDRVTLHSRPCACGSHLPVIDVQGRSDDTLRLGLPGAQPVCVLPLALSTVLEDDAGLYDFQLVQQGPSELVLNTGMRGEAASSMLRRARETLADFLERQGAAGVHIHCRSGQPRQLGRSGKAQRVVAAVQ